MTLPLPLSIRRLEPADAPACRALRRAGLRESPSACGSSAEEEETLPRVVSEGRLAGVAGRAMSGAFDGATLAGLAGPGRLRLCVNADDTDDTATTRLHASLGFETFGRENDAVDVDGCLHDGQHMALRCRAGGGAA